MTTQPGLTVTPNVRTDLSQFGDFRYDTVQVVGLAPSAATSATTTVNDFIEGVVADWASEQDSADCEAGIPQCGSFELTVRPEPCQGYLCVRVDSGGAHVGAATGDEATATFVIDPVTGKQMELSDVVAASEDKAIEKAVRDWQYQRDLYPADFEYSLRDISGWIPMQDGLHIWFPKYVIGPGSEGAPEIVVPIGSRASQTSGPVIVANQDEAIAWLCQSLGPDSMPGLTKGSDDTYAVSVVQSILSTQGYLNGSKSVDGVFGPATLRAIKRYQSDQGLAADGVVGPRTWQSLSWACTWAADDADAAAGAQQEQADQQAQQQTQPGPQQPNPVRPAAPQTSQLPQYVVVPDVRGMPVSTAQAILQGAGLRLAPVAMSTTAYVKSQAPGPGLRVAQGTSVVILLGY